MSNVEAPVLSIAVVLSRLQNKCDATIQSLMLANPYGHCTEAIIRDDNFLANGILVIQTSGRCSHDLYDVNLQAIMVALP